MSGVLDQQKHQALVTEFTAARADVTSKVARTSECRRALYDAEQNEARAKERMAKAALAVAVSSAGPEAVVVA